MHLAMNRESALVIVACWTCEMVAVVGRLPCDPELSLLRPEEH